MVPVVVAPVVLALVVVATVVVAPVVVAAVPFTTVALPVPSCWKTISVPLRETFWVWRTVSLDWTIEKLDEKSTPPEHTTPLLHCQDSESWLVQVRLLPLKIELQLGPAQVIARENIWPVLQNMNVPFVVVMIAIDLRAKARLLDKRD